MALKYLIFLMAGAMAMPAAGEVRDPSVRMETVAGLDLGRYMGQWFEIARFPNRFEAGCTHVTAVYGLRDDDDISVANSCTKAGATKVARGKAWMVADGKLKVTFVPFLGALAAGDYWVLDVTPDYTMAVVGAPKGGFGWILAREPSLPSALKERALRVLAANGYDGAQLEWVQH